VIKQRFYVDATARNPHEKNAVYVRGINAPIWVGYNETVAKEGAQRLNDAEAIGALVGWPWEDKTGLGLPLRRKGWTVDDLISAAKGGELDREAIRRAGTLIQAIAVVANGKAKR
jgi:hypothetical protein